MKKRILAILLIILCTLSGCSLFQGQYYRVTPHKMDTSNTDMGAYSAQNYRELRQTLGAMIRNGTGNGIVYTDGFEPEELERSIREVIRNVCSSDPIGAFAVEDITYQIGTNNGRTAVAVDIRYGRSPAELQQLIQVEDLAEAQEKILEALGNCSPKMTLFINSYKKTDFTQVVWNLAQINPQIVMEIPHVRESVYGEGSSRVIELNFMYENSRDSLRQMQNQVRPIFDAAALYVSGEDSDRQKFSQLYAFLMERYDYAVETSITPAYSLLRHGVGDSRAFATVYASMCRKAGLDCRTVTGTRMGDSWTWNMVLEDGVYYHVDLLRCTELGGFREGLDESMVGYVWDYSGYPKCTGEPAEAAETDS